MADDIETGLARLEQTIAFLREGNFADWYGAYVAAGKQTSETGSENWAAIRDLIVVATHGAPHELSYLDEELKSLIARTSE